MNKETVTVHIKYLDAEQTFTGDVNHVWVSVNRFFSEVIPALQIVKKALLTVDLENLIEDCKNIIAVAPEGPVLLVSRRKLTANETLTLHLLATYIGNKLGLSKIFLTKEELLGVWDQLLATGSFTVGKVRYFIRERAIESEPA